MGIFSRNARSRSEQSTESYEPATSRLEDVTAWLFMTRDFTMPCTPTEALYVINNTVSPVNGDSSNKVYPFGGLSASDGQPPLMETIYADSIHESGFDIVAGNRVNTHWRMRLTFSGSNPTHGKYEAIERNSDKWYGNLQSMIYTLENAIASVGGQTGTWPNMP